MNLLVLIILSTFTASSTITERPTDIRTDSDVSSTNLWSSVKLMGSASGGTLGLRNLVLGKDACVDTATGEAGDVVSERFSESLRRAFSPEIGIADYSCRAVRSELFLMFDFKGTWALWGTESGFPIPSPPRNLTAAYDSETKKVALTWQMPNEPYTFAYFEYGEGAGPVARLDVADRPKVQRVKVWREGGGEPFGDFFITGTTQGAFSSAGAISVREKHQEELYPGPFWHGIAPNWTSWKRSVSESQPVCEQGVKDGACRHIVSAKGPDEKPFYQVVRSADPNCTGGVWRHFLALQSGHRYRIYIRLNTLGVQEGSSGASNWSFSAHATLNMNPSVEGLTTDQFTGIAPLPDGSVGLHAGELAVLGPMTTTKGQWTEFSSGKNKGQLADITISPGFDSITVWLRITGQVATGVGMDWIKLEDVTDKPES